MYSFPIISIYENTPPLWNGCFLNSAKTHQKETLLAVAIEVRMFVFICILLPEIYLYRITHHEPQHSILYSTSVYKLFLNFTYHVITAQCITSMRWMKFAYFPLQYDMKYNPCWYREILGDNIFITSFWRYVTVQLVIYFVLMILLYFITFV